MRARLDVAALDDAALSQLLGRPIATPNLRAARHVFEGRRVMVTGAAGSIGFALSQALAKLGCRSLALLDTNDHGLCEAMAQLQPEAGGVVTEVLCDIRDSVRLARVFDRHRPEIVVHAAALKHVHLGERHPGECFLTNVVGVRNTLAALAGIGGGRFVFVSSDKAANPVSVMGACKRLAEMWVRDAGGTAGLETMFVRFGNVFGTQGSVAHAFAAQIAAEGPVRVTHPDMERYFMTAREAVGLILSAAAQGSAAPDAGVGYLLEMGEPLRIVTLAERMIHLAGRIPHAEVPIAFTALREGERLHEDLFDHNERLRPSAMDGLLELSESRPRRRMTADLLATLESEARTRSDQVVSQRVFAVLKDILGEEPAAAAG